MIDLSDTLAAKSDQLNADDLMGGPRTVTITEVRVVRGEQPTIVELEGYPGRPYKPGLSMRRVLVAAWGPDGAAYVGRRLTLYRDPEVRFGKLAVGGIRISHMSGLPGGRPLSVPLTVKKGVKELWTVEPLPDHAPTDTPAPSARQRLGAAVRDAGWGKAEVEAEVGHALDGFDALTDAEVQQLLATLMEAQS